MKRTRLIQILVSTLATLLVLSGFLTPAFAQLPYGPDTCLDGYVWREAFLNDHVCVTPETRTQAAFDNSQADVRRQPGGGIYGPYTCASGYVWREATPFDLVCVTPEVREQTARDNAAAASRLAANYPPGVRIDPGTNLVPAEPE